MDLNSIYVWSQFTFWERKGPQTSSGKRCEFLTSNRTVYQFKVPPEFVMAQWFPLR